MPGQEPLRRVRLMDWVAVNVHERTQRAVAVDDVEGAEESLAFVLRQTGLILARVWELECQPWWKLQLPPDGRLRLKHLRERHRGREHSLMCGVLIMHGFAGGETLSPFALL